MERYQEVDGVWTGTLSLPEVYRNTVPDKLLVVDAFDPGIPYQTSEKISLRVKNSEESKNPAAGGRRDPHGNKDGKMQKSTGKRRKSRNRFVLSY